MGRTKKNVTAPEAVKEPQEVSQGIQEIERNSEAAVTPEIIGPESETDLAGRQEAEDEVVLAKGMFIVYAVTAEGGLRLRREPSLNAPVIAELPWGAGVFGNGDPPIDGWRQVFTGRLSGWMMAEYLEPVAVPESL